jgi:hypothetical protein
MAKQSPFYRGIYTYVVANKPNGTTVKANPKYRGIYAYDATKKPSGVLLFGGETLTAFGGLTEQRRRATDNRTEEAQDNVIEEPAPWDDFTQHNQLDDYATGEDLERPAGWSSMTIAQKKGWLDNHA